MLQELRAKQPIEFKEKNLRQLYCWRLFFYLEDIKELGSVQEMLANYQTTQFYLMLNLHNDIASFKLTDLKDKQNLAIKAIKLMYLFSEKEKIDKFLNKSEIVIRITYEQNWNSVIAEGSTNSLYHESEKFSMRKYKQILLFNERSKYCVLGLHLGVKMDGLYNTDKLTLNKIYDAYVAN